MSAIRLAPYRRLPRLTSALLGSVLIGLVVQLTNPVGALASTAPALQLPWPTGQQQNINGGYTYNCGDHTGLDADAIDFNLALHSQVSAVADGIAHDITGTTGYGN